jgi:hypothetical protein
MNKQRREILQSILTKRYSPSRERKTYDHSEIALAHRGMSRVMPPTIGRGGRTAGGNHMTTIQVRCAWCGKTMGSKDGDGQTGVSSHGICPDCRETVSKEKETK